MELANLRFLFFIFQMIFLQFSLFVSLLTIVAIFIPSETFHHLERYDVRMEQAGLPPPVAFGRQGTKEGQEWCPVDTSCIFGTCKTGNHRLY